MKVRVSHLPPEGLPIKTEMSLESLNTRMSEGRETDILFTVPPAVDLVVTKTAQGAETKGRVSTKYRQACSRCADPVEKELSIEANFILQRRPDPKDNPEADPRDYEDDIGITFFDGDQVDLANVLEEALILPLSMFWHPPCDSKGNCTHCGKHCEGEEQAPPKLETVSLGDLLKKAGVSKN